MLPFKLVYHPGYDLNLGSHVFPSQKFRLLYELVLTEKIAESCDILQPDRASDQDLTLAHTPEWVASNTMSRVDDRNMAIVSVHPLVPITPNGAESRPRARRNPPRGNAMTKLTQSPDIEAFLDQIAGLASDKGADARKKAIIRKIVADLFDTIDSFDVTDDEFWFALNFMAAGAPEYGLWAAGLGFERFLDIRADIKDQAAGVPEGTPRTIEGPLYIAGAPLSKGEARLDDGTEKGEVLFMDGQVRDTAASRWRVRSSTCGTPTPRAATRSSTRRRADYNLRRRIETDAEGRYRFRSHPALGLRLPAGRADAAAAHWLGRHGQRPAHIHFFVSAPGFRKLTTQINIDGRSVPARRLRLRHARRTDPGRHPP